MHKIEPYDVFGVGGNVSFLPVKVRGKRLFLCKGKVPAVCPGHQRQHVGALLQTRADVL